MLSDRDFLIQSKMKSLLSKSLRQFAVCAAVCFALTAPLFYLLTKHFYAEDMADIIEAVNEGRNIPPLDFERDVMAGMMLQFVLIFLVIMLAMFITTRFATRRLWRPFDDTLLKAERFNLAQGSVPHFAPTGISEFARLNQSLERLMRKDSETYRIQKEFTENASHELQTPLAVIRSKLDLLMQEHLGRREMQIVSDLYALTTRMSHMNRSLLLLAKIDNAQYAALQAVDIAQVLSESQPMYEALLHGTTLRLVDNRPMPQGSIHANTVLLECMLKNLIVNAIRYSPAGGEIIVVLTGHTLTVSNTAAGGRPLNAEKLFCRFSQADAPPGSSPDMSHSKGNGLGLAIVKAICDFHHWDVQYRFEQGRHMFVVTFDLEVDRLES